MKLTCDVEEMCAEQFVLTQLCATQSLLVARP
jgi:hypothetical protein